MDFRRFCASVQKPYISLEVLAFADTYKLWTIDLINTKLWDFVIYNTLLFKNQFQRKPKIYSKKIWSKNLKGKYKKKKNLKYQFFTVSLDE